VQRLVVLLVGTFRPDYLDVLSPLFISFVKPHQTETTGRAMIRSSTYGIEPGSSRRIKTPTQTGRDDCAKMVGAILATMIKQMPPIKGIIDGTRSVLPVTLFRNAWIMTPQLKTVQTSHTHSSGTTRTQRNISIAIYDARKAVRRQHHTKPRARKYTLIRPYFGSAF